MQGNRITSVLNLSAMYAIIFGAYILWPWTNLFHTSGTLYAPMTAMVDSEGVWGGLMFTSGLWALALGAVHRQAAGNVLMTLLFTAFSVLFFIGDAERPGGPLFAVLALFNFAQYWGASWNNRSQPKPAAHSG